MEHFEDLLSTNTSGEAAAEQNQNTENVQPASREEIEKASGKLKNNKAASMDEIPAELLKNGGSALVESLHLLFYSPRLGMRSYYSVNGIGA